MNRVVDSFGNVVVAVLMSCALAGTPSAYAQEKAEMPLHHIHISMMNHGLEMVAQGANYQMIAAMNMDPKVKADIDDLTSSHSREMFTDGKDLIKRGMEGPAMQKLHEEVGKTGATMQYTHDLGQAMMNVANIQEGMKHEFPSDKAMTMHHIHLALNHALVMATDGSEQIMLGQMGMSPKVDPVSIEHGRKMISDARTIVTRAMQSQSYKDMMADEQTKRMARTQELADSSLKVIDLLEKMPGATPAKP
ncbi:hypothetical protein [Methylocaldum sp.]|uniref:hypothetical protein n=1 Tax=Methylocaldum sp. TaxID=1969727 RepID=UPI002D451C3B|nr:hypothetical protein [Methylocaldum sp.]HYE35924.1 hypothetical protein [Methylocaldum sp.]